MRRPRRNPALAGVPKLFGFRRRRRRARPHQRDGLTHPENLQRLAALLADGNLRIPVQATYDLAQAPEALAGTHTQGKLAIQVH